MKEQDLEKLATSFEECWKEYLRCRSEGTMPKKQRMRGGFEDERMRTEDTKKSEEEVYTVRSTVLVKAFGVARGGKGT